MKFLLVNGEATMGMCSTPFDWPELEAPEEKLLFEAPEPAEAPDEGALRDVLRELTSLERDSWIWAC